MQNFIRYTGGDLNRVGNLRKNSRWINKQFKKSSGRIIPVWRNQNLIKTCNQMDVKNSRKTGMPQALLLSQKEFPDIIEKANQAILLGLQRKRPIIAVDLSCEQKHQLKQKIGDGKFLDLREVGSLLCTNDSALLAYARGIISWHQKNQFCSRCGSVSISQDGGHMRLCSNQKCLNPSFPRTDPAVIMLVESGNSLKKEKYCLLGRQKLWPKGMYSTLAGFVEPGESLEEAVAREVYEESGIKTSKIIYECSQPWPFPSSIMLGFRATAETKRIKIDKQELEDVRWFSSAEMRKFGEWGDQESVYNLPRKDSIARFLIETWLTQKQ